MAGVGGPLACRARVAGRLLGHDPLDLVSSRRRRSGRLGLGRGPYCPGDPARRDLKLVRRWTRLVAVADAVNIHDAKTHFSKLIERVEAGEEIVIARAGTPVARLAPLALRDARRPGGAEGAIVIHDDFDDPLPADLRDAFGLP